MRASKISNFSRNKGILPHSAFCRFSYPFVITLVCFLALVFLLSGGCSNRKNNEDFDLHYKVYVPNLSSNTITVIPALKSNDTLTLELQNQVGQIALRPGSNTLFALVSGTNDITLIDTEDDTIGETFKFQAGTTGAHSLNRILFNSNGSKAYLTTSYGPSGIAVMDVADRSFATGINVFSTSLTRMFFSSNGNRLFALDPGMSNIYEIDSAQDTLLRIIESPESFEDALYDPDTGLFYMISGSTVKEFNPVDLIFERRLENVTSNPILLAFSPDKDFLYVIGNSEIVTVKMSDFTLDQTFTLENSSPTDFRFLPDDSFALVPSSSSGLLMILEPDDFVLEHTIDTGSNPGEIVILPEKHESEDSDNNSDNNEE